MAALGARAGADLSAENLDVERESELLEDLLPQLAGTDYLVTSPSTGDYNCVAWALGTTSGNWSPAPSGPYRWPAHLPRVPLVSVMADLFRERGYEECSNPGLEPGTEKIALFGDATVGEVVHAARQLPDGRWTSKLGDAADIEHAELEAVGGSVYGDVQMLMARRAESEAPLAERVARVPLLIVRRLTNWRGD